MDAPEASGHESNLLPRVLGPVEAFCVVVGCVIGSGIFLVPASVARNVPFVGEIVLVWVVGGLFSTAGALTLAELAAMMPHAGGPYVYLRAAYGPISGLSLRLDRVHHRPHRVDGHAGRGVRPLLRSARPAAGMHSRSGLAGGRGDRRDRGGHRGERPGHAAGGSASGLGDGSQGRRGCRPDLAFPCYSSAAAWATSAPPGRRSSAARCSRA